MQAAIPSSSGVKIGESAAVELADGSKEIEDDPLAKDPNAPVMIVKYPSGGFTLMTAAAFAYREFISALCVSDIINPAARILHPPDMIEGTGLLIWNHGSVSMIWKIGGAVGHTERNVELGVELDTPIVKKIVLDEITDPGSVSAIKKSVEVFVVRYAVAL